MKKILLCLGLLSFVNLAYAQEEIPVFDDTPNIGKDAEPLDKLLLTPSPLPEVWVDLSESSEERKDNQKRTQKTASQNKQDASKPLPASNKPLSLTQKSGKDSAQGTSHSAGLASDMADAAQSALAKGTPTTTTQNNSAANDVNVPEECLMADNLEACVFQYKSKNMHEVTVTTTTTTTTQGTGAIQSQEDLSNLFGKVHDVHGFDVAGLSLGMSPAEVLAVMKSMGYKRTDVRYAIPMFRTLFYEHNCKNKQIYALTAIRECIEKQANRDAVKYVSSMTFARADTKEYIRVLFTSLATENLAFKIYYESKGDNSLTMTQHNLAKQLQRKDLFWKMMFETYGLPDDSEEIVWGDPNKAYMQATMNGSAYNAYIVLEDKEIQDEDYFAAEDERPDLKYRNPFTFAPDYVED